MNCNLLKSGPFFSKTNTEKRGFSASQGDSDPSLPWRTVQLVPLLPQHTATGPGKLMNAGKAFISKIYLVLRQNTGNKSQ